MITRDNYEEFFLDYHEGNLNPEMVAELFVFLDNNTDLREVFEAYENFSIQELEKDFPDHNVFFAEKDKLKRNAIDKNNIDEYLIKFVEKKLSDEQELALKGFLQKNPAYQASLDLYRKTLLTPEMQIVFPGKSELKKSLSALTVKNEEEYIAYYIDGALNPLECEQVEDYGKTRQQVARLIDLYRNTKLVADSSIVFLDKDSLKNIPQKKRRAFYYYLSIAAGVLLFLSAGFFLNNISKKDVDKNPPISKVENRREEEIVRSQAANNGILPEEKELSQMKEKHTNSYKGNSVATNNNKSGLMKTEYRSKLVKDTNEAIVIQMIAKENNSSPKEIPSIELNPQDTVVFLVAAKEEIIERKQDKFLTMKQLLVGKAKTQGKSSKQTIDCDEEKKKITVSDIVALGNGLIKKVFGSEMEITTKQNDCGDVMAISIRSNELEFQKQFSK